jgi:hypothetical protein
VTLNSRSLTQQKFISKTPVQSSEARALRAILVPVALNQVERLNLEIRHQSIVAEANHEQLTPEKYWQSPVLSSPPFQVLAGKFPMNAKASTALASPWALRSCMMRIASTVKKRIG